MAKRFGEAAIRFRPKTLGHLIHLAPYGHLVRRLTDLGRLPYGDAAQPVSAGVGINATVQSSFSRKLGKKPTKLAHSCFATGLCIHAQRIVEESLRQNLSC